MSNMGDAFENQGMNSTQGITFNFGLLDSSPQKILSLEDNETNNSLSLMKSMRISQQNSLNQFDYDKLMPSFESKKGFGGKSKQLTHGKIKESLSINRANSNNSNLLFGKKITGNNSEVGNYSDTSDNDNKQPFRGNSWRSGTTFSGPRITVGNSSNQYETNSNLGSSSSMFDFDFLMDN